MRSIGLDVHRDFCAVAIADEEGLRSAGRVETTPEALRLFAESLGPDDQVALEATGNALAIAAILRPHVGRVVLANPAAVRGELNAPKTDKIDARSLARLLATGFLPEVWAPDPDTAALRGQLARRRQLVKQRTARRTRSTPCCSATSSASRWRVTFSVPRAATGWPRRSCLTMSARQSRRACVTSTSSMPRWPRSTAGSPSGCSPRARCAASCSCRNRRDDRGDADRGDR
jgi:hypothetical protein